MLLTTKIRALLPIVLCASTLSAQADVNLDLIHKSCTSFSSISAAALEARNRGVPLSNLIAAATKLKSAGKDVPTVMRILAKYTAVAYDVEKSTPPSVFREVVYETCLAQMLK